MTFTYIEVCYLTQFLSLQWIPFTPKLNIMVTNIDRIIHNAPSSSNQARSPPKSNSKELYFLSTLQSIYSTQFIRWPGIVFLHSNSCHQNIARFNICTSVGEISLYFKRDAISLILPNSKHSGITIIPSGTFRYSQ